MAGDSQPKRTARALVAVNRDREAGDLGSARLRLMSLAASRRYDPSLCEFIAVICLEMKDPVEAGRWFFLCESDHPQAQECIDRFVARCGGIGEQVLGRLPFLVRHQVREGSTRHYIAQRLKNLRVTSVAKPPPPRSSTRAAALANVGAGLFACLFAICFIVGVGTVVVWLLRLVFGP